MAYEGIELTPTENAEVEALSNQQRQRQRRWDALGENQ